MKLPLALLLLALNLSLATAAPIVWPVGQSKSTPAASQTDSTKPGEKINGQFTRGRRPNQVKKPATHWPRPKDVITSQRREHDVPRKQDSYGKSYRRAVIEPRWSPDEAGKPFPEQDYSVPWTRGRTEAFKSSYLRVPEEETELEESEAVGIEEELMAENMKEEVEVEEEEPYRNLEDFIMRQRQMSLDEEYE